MAQAVESHVADAAEFKKFLDDKMVQGQGNWPAAFLYKPVFAGADGSGPAVSVGVREKDGGMSYYGVVLMRPEAGKPFDRYELVTQDRLNALYYALPDTEEKDKSRPYYGKEKVNINGEMKYPLRRDFTTEEALRNAAGESIARANKSVYDQLQVLGREPAVIQPAVVVERATLEGMKNVTVPAQVVKAETQKAPDNEAFLKELAAQKDNPAHRIPGMDKIAGIGLVQIQQVMRRDQGAVQPETQQTIRLILQQNPGYAGVLAAYAIDLAGGRDDMRKYSNQLGSAVAVKPEAAQGGGDFKAQLKAIAAQDIDPNANGAQKGGAASALYKMSRMIPNEGNLSERLEQNFLKTLEAFPGQASVMAQYILDSLEKGKAQDIRPYSEAIQKGHKVGAPEGHSSVPARDVVDRPVMLADASGAVSGGGRRQMSAAEAMKEAMRKMQAENPDVAAAGRGLTQKEMREMMERSAAGGGGMIDPAKVEALQNRWKAAAEGKLARETTKGSLDAKSFVPPKGDPMEAYDVAYKASREIRSFYEGAGKSGLNDADKAQIQAVIQGFRDQGYDGYANALQKMNESIEGGAKPKDAAKLAKGDLMNARDKAYEGASHAEEVAPGAKMPAPDPTQERDQTREVLCQQLGNNPALKALCK
ncbi:MAG: hypothetical protein KDI13_09330 [Alphaproteobacteria bacterium]|nr:hypothetical protein [Alphaproteobacteria bacterium]